MQCILDIVALFPIFYFEYFFGEMFFTDFGEFNISLFWVLLGIQAMYITLRSSGIIIDAVATTRDTLTSYLKRGPSMKSKNKVKPLLSLAQQVQFATIFLLCDILALLTITLNFSVFSYLAYYFENESFADSIRMSFKVYKLTPDPNGIWDFIIRFRDVLIAKLPFHFMAFIIISARINNRKRKQRDTSSVSSSVFEWAYRLIQGGSWLFVIVSSVSISIVAYANLSLIISSSNFRQINPDRSTNVTEGGMTNATFRVYEDMYVRIFRDEWFYQ